MDINIVILEQLAMQLGIVLQATGRQIVTAESCTGGMLAQALTSSSGSSKWFDCGFVSYSNAAKQHLLGVNADSLETYGAVSQEVAQEMAQGALLNSRAHCSIAITGIAGPEGGSIEKPVGTVWFAWAFQSPEKPRVEVAHEQFSGDRRAVRMQAAEFALWRMLAFILK